jgi:hypothetical protein
VTPRKCDCGFASDTIGTFFVSWTAGLNILNVSPTLGWIVKVFECNNYIDPLGPRYIANVSTSSGDSGPQLLTIVGSAGARPLGARQCYSVTIAGWNSVGVGSFSPFTRY